MKAKLIIVSVALLVIVAAIAWAYLAPTPTGPVQNTGANFPSAGSTATGSNSFTIGTSSSAYVPSSNFITSSSTTRDPYNPGQYFLGYAPPASGAAQPPYLIEYISTTQFFNVELLKEPIGQSRLAAEAFLENDLGIGQKQMCELDYMVSVPDSVNSFYSSRDLGWSFCPGATALPQ